MALQAVTFRWPGKSYEAAALMADGVTWPETARRVGISERQLAAWHVRPEFQARVAELKQEAADALAAEGIANRQNQLRILQADFNRTDIVIEERAADPELAQALGGRSGIVTRKFRTIPSNDPEVPAMVVTEDAVDTGLLEARGKLLDRAAKVAGWGDEKPETRIAIDIRAQASQIAVVLGVPLERLLAEAEQLALNAGEAP